jgi:hypothetical protein
MAPRPKAEALGYQPWPAGLRFGVGSGGSGGEWGRGAVALLLPTVPTCAGMSRAHRMV